MFSILKRKLSTLFDMTHEERRLFVEAVYYLAVARFYVRFLPFRWYVNSLGSDEPDTLRAMGENTLASNAVGKAISRASNNVHWNAVCLPKSIAAKWMLAKRDVPSMLFLGVSTSNGGLPGQAPPQQTMTTKIQLSAHAWLKAGNMVVTGEAGYKKYTILKTFY